MLGNGDAAAALMLARGYQPLEPYPGCNAPWRCLHLPCGADVRARYGKVRAGEGCCAPCGVAASTVKRQADPRTSATIMLDNLLEPLEPYPGGNHRPWKCQCLRCGAIVSPTRANIRRGQGGCVPCGKKKSALGRMGDAGIAAAEMLAALLEPLEDYPGSNNAWRCRCLRCGDEVRPRLVHIRAGRGGCLTCGFASNRLKQLGDPVQAVADIQAEGYHPLEDYPGASKPWRARHEPCGNEVVARLQKIRSGEGCCAHCATYGFNLTAPAVVYVLHHAELAAVKVGITAADSDRVERFIRRSWTLAGTRRFATGAQAREVEQSVLRHLRVAQGLRPYLNEQQTPGTGGSTETFSTQQVSPSTMLRLVAANSRTKR
jgi:hypothetical protein